MSADQAFDPALVEQFAAAVHDRGWVPDQAAAGRTSVTSRITGRELMVPYNQLDDADQQADRSTARAVLGAAVAAGYLVAGALDADTPPPPAVHAVIDGAGYIWGRCRPNGPLWWCLTIPEPARCRLTWRELQAEFPSLTPLVRAIPMGAPR